MIRGRASPCLKPPIRRSRPRKKVRRSRSSSPFSLCCWRLQKPARKTPSTCRRKKISRPDLFNFYQAKRIRSTVVETAAATLEAQKSAVTDPKAQEAFEKQIADFKATVARYEKDPKKPEDSMDAIQDRAKEASEARELANRRLGHYELGSGLTQIAIVLASAAIITGITALVWLSGVLGAIGAALIAFGFFAPTVLSFIG